MVFDWFQVLILSSAADPWEKRELLAKAWGISRGMETEKRPTLEEKPGFRVGQQKRFKSPTSVCCLVQRSWNPPPPHHHHHVTHTQKERERVSITLTLRFTQMLTWTPSCYRCSLYLQLFSLLFGSNAVQFVNENKQSWADSRQVKDEEKVVQNEGRGVGGGGSLQRVHVCVYLCFRSENPANTCPSEPPPILLS